MSNFMPPGYGPSASGPADQPDIAALLGQAGQPGPGALAPPEQAPPQQADPLEALQEAIHALTSAMVALPDPQDTQDAAKALVQLAGIQTRLMGKNASPQG